MLPSHLVDSDTNPLNFPSVLLTRALLLEALINAFALWSLQISLLKNRVNIACGTPSRLVIYVTTIDNNRISPIIHMAIRSLNILTLQS